MLEVLRRFWEHVEPLTDEDALRYLERFKSQRLKSEFRTKFASEFDSAKPITSRFFVRSRVRDRSIEFSELFGRASDRLAATVLWGPLTSPAAFRLEGASKSLGDILFIDADACVSVSHKTRNIDLFYDSSRETVYEL